MFFVWIVGVAKVVVDFDGLDDVRDCFGSERSNAYRHDGMTLAEVLSEFVVEISNAFGLSGLARSSCRLQCGWGCESEPIRRDGTAAADGGWASDGLVRLVG